MPELDVSVKLTIGCDHDTSLHSRFNEEKGVSKGGCTKRVCQSIRSGGTVVIPPTAPLVAPARTEVKGICSLGSYPRNLLNVLRKGS